MKQRYLLEVSRKERPTRSGPSKTPGFQGAGIVQMASTWRHDRVPTAVTGAGHRISDIETIGIAPEMRTLRDTVTATGKERPDMLPSCATGVDLGMDVKR